MMADTSNPIFNKKAAEKLRSPDDLDKYVRVTNPGVWVILAACVSLLAGLLAWGVFGSVTTSVTTTGAVIDIGAVTANVQNADIDGSKAAVCFLSAEDVAKVQVGNEADVGGKRMVVKYVAPIPNSPEEWDAIMESKYLVKTLISGDWAYPVVFEGDISELDAGVPLTVNITTSRVAPISLILKHWG